MAMLICVVNVSYVALICVDMFFIIFVFWGGFGFSEREGRRYVCIKKNHKKFVVGMRL
jgi:hypothetical protein